MSSAIRLLQGGFGRVALLDMDKPLVAHAHHHCHILIKVSGADTSFAVRDRCHPLTERSAVLVNAWESHAYIHDEAAGCSTVILALYVEPAWLAEIQRQFAVSAHPKFFPEPCVQLTTRARKLADELTAEMLMPAAMSSARVEELLFDLVVEIVERHCDRRNFGELLRGGHGRGIDPRIRRAIAHMREDGGAGLDIEQLAADCRLSRAHFFALFRRSTNLTPNLYANVLRMERAIRVLSAESAPICDIGYDIGFSAPGHFTRFFREHLGITPSEYRRVVDVVDRGDAAAASH